MKIDRDSWVKKYNDMRTEYNMLKESCGSGGSAKEKASQLFNLLQNRYLDRMTLLSSQQKVLQKQNTVLSNKEEEINKSEKILSDFEDKIQRDKRIVRHDMRFNETKGRLVFFAKIVFVILCIILLVILAMKLKK